MLAPSLPQEKALPLPCPLPSLAHSSNSSGEKKLPRPQQEEEEEGATAGERGDFWQGCTGNTVTWGRRKKLQY